VPPLHLVSIAIRSNSAADLKGFRSDSSRPQVSRRALKDIGERWRSLSGNDRQRVAKRSAGHTNAVLGRALEESFFPGAKRTAGWPPACACFLRGQRVCIHRMLRGGCLPAVWSRCGGGSLTGSSLRCRLERRGRHARRSRPTWDTGATTTGEAVPAEGASRCYECGADAMRWYLRTVSCSRVEPGWVEHWEELGSDWVTGAPLKTGHRGMAPSMAL